MTDFPRLIEHAFPLKQMSLDSVHEKNVRHGHVSTPHVWLACRPSAARRAAFIATLLLDPPVEPKPEGLTHNAGIGLTPTYPQSDVRGERAIEVKGRASTGDVEVSSNEWARATNLRDGYWLYAVYDCATPAPRLARVQDPFSNLLAKAKGSVLIGMTQIVRAATEDSQS